MGFCKIILSEGDHNKLFERLHVAPKQTTSTPASSMLEEILSVFAAKLDINVRSIKPETTFL